MRKNCILHFRLILARRMISRRLFSPVQVYLINFQARFSSKTKPGMKKFDSIFFSCFHGEESHRSRFYISSFTCYSAGLCTYTFTLFMNCHKRACEKHLVTFNSQRVRNKRLKTQRY